mgnify:CR=1 FL=1
METIQFNARLAPDTITKIKQLQVTIGRRNTPPNDLSQGDVVSLAVNLLHSNELGQSGKKEEKKRRSA